MASIILPSRWTRQPPLGTQYDTTIIGGGELFHCNGIPVDPNRSNVAEKINACAPTVGLGVEGINVVFSGNDSAFVSPNSVAPPQNISIFAVARPTATWGGNNARDTNIGGFVYANQGNTTIIGGSACISLHAFLENFGNKVVGVNLTYSDSTSESIYLAGGVGSNRDPWFIGCSYADASRVTLFARNLVTGETFSSTTSKTKSLNSVSQKFNILSAAPNGTSSWASVTPNKRASYIGWADRALTLPEWNNLASNPWQIFRPQKRILYFDVGGGGDSVTSSPIAFQWETTTGSLLETTTITGSPIAYQWEVTGASVNESVVSIPATWAWTTTTGTLLEQLTSSPITFQWQVTTGSIVEGNFTTDIVETTPVDFQWEQTSAAFISRLEGNTVNFEWQINTGALTENLSTQPVAFQWETTTGELLGTTSLECTPVEWQWEVTTASFVVATPEVGSQTIGGKKDKTRKSRNKLPYYESTEYESKIILEDIPEEPKPAKVRKTRQKTQPVSDIVVNADKDVKLISELVSEIKPVQIMPTQVASEIVMEAEDGMDEETAVIMLLLAA